MQTTERVTISEALDLIWEETSDRNAQAQRVATLLPDDALALLAAWDAGAVFGFREGELRQLANNPLPAVELNIGQGVGVFRLDLVRTGQAADASASTIDLLETEVSAAVVRYDEKGIKFHLRHAVSHLLLVLQFARDHLEGMLFLPREIRDHRIAELAEDLSLPEAHCRELLLAFPLIRRYSDPSFKP